MQLGSASRGSGFQTGSFEVKNEINVTPLVDVCLVLLIIFMVVTPMLQSGVDVQLPETGKPERIAESARELKLAIRADGSVFIGQNWVTQDKLQATLTAIYNQNPEKQVTLKADRRLKYKDVRKVMQIVNEAGFSGVGLITHRKEAPVH